MKDRCVRLGEQWRDLNRAIHDRMREAWRGTELHPGAMFLLRHLQDEPGLTVSELARRAGVVKSGVSKLIDHVARAGLVEKQPDPNDQRLLRLFMTEQGRSTLAEMEETVRTAWLSIVQQLPAEQIAEVEKGLRILQAAVAAADSEASKGDEPA